MEKQGYGNATPPSYTAQPPPNQNAAPAAVPYPYGAPAPAPTPYPPQQYPPPTSPYPPPPGQLPPGQPYAPPPTGYPPQQGYSAPQYVASPPPPQPQQQQQQQVVVVTGAQSQQPVIVQHVQSFAGHIAFACIVFWCCNWLFGLIAFILAMVASSTAVSDPTGARRLGHASIGLSVAGIIVTVVLIIIVVAVYATAAASCAYTYYGICYSDYDYVGRYGYCSGVKVGSYCYH